MTNREGQVELPLAEKPAANLLDVLRTLFRWKKVIIGACILAGVGSSIIALVLPVYYKAGTVFYALSPDQANPELLFSDAGYVPQLYGNENDIDRLLTIGESHDLVFFMVDSFKLYEHYNIDPNSAKSPLYVSRKFNGLYDVTKTKRDALELTIEDKDPQRAADMARAARERINSLGQSLIKAAQQKTIATYTANVAAQEVQLRILSDTLEYLRTHYGIYNTESQSDGLSGLLSFTESQLAGHRAKYAAYQTKGARFRDSVAVYEVKIAGLEDELVQVQTKLQRFNEGLGRVYNYTRQYQELNNNLSREKEKLKKYQAIYASTTPAIVLVEDAAVPVVKSRPARMILVFASVVLTFVATVLGVLLFEAYKGVDWRAVYEGR